jgi:ubiquinone/menaquinone biosynthesis C-methylase UbiE
VGSVNFDRAADFYDQTRTLPADSMAAITELLAAELAGRQPCLEIGVGTGRIARPLRDRGIALAGVDISAGMLARLVADAGGEPPFPLLRADATRLPLCAGGFGAVLAVHVLHLIPDWRVAVDEALRVLRPGGALVAGLQGQGRAQWSDSEA